MGEIAANAVSDTITRLWIAADLYKHRAMRMNGIPEQLTPLTTGLSSLSAAQSGLRDCFVPCLGGGALTGD